MSGRVAQVAQGIRAREKGAIRFWKYRPFTRIVRGWRQAFRRAQDYIHLNILEGEGFIKRSDVASVKELRTLIADST